MKSTQIGAEILTKEERERRRKRVLIASKKKNDKLLTLMPKMDDES